MQITLGECPQSTNSLYRTTCNGGHPNTYMTRKGKRIKSDYVLEAQSQWSNNVTDEDIEIYIDFYFPTAHRRDIDNYFKIVLDSLEGVVYEDDSQIQKMTVTKDIDRDNPRVEITVDN